MPDTSTTPTSEHAAARFRRGDIAEFAWVTFDDGWAVYHRPSGKTHFLNPTAAFLLFEVLQQPRTASEATELLLESQSEPIQDVQHEFVRDLLQHFVELGIITR